RAVHRLRAVHAHVPDAARGLPARRADRLHRRHAALHGDGLGRGAAAASRRPGRAACRWRPPRAAPLLRGVDRRGRRRAVVAGDRGAVGPAMGPVALRRLSGAGLLALAGAAAAHDVDEAAHAASAAWPWSFEPWVLACLALSIAAYALGLVRLWRQAGAGRGVSVAQAVWFGSGWLVLALALVSPIDPLGGRLL